MNRPQTLPWRIVPSLFGCYDFVYHSPVEDRWMTITNPVLMLTLDGKGTLYRRDAPQENPVDAGEHRLYYLAPNSVRFVRGERMQKMHLIALQFIVEFQEGPNFFQYFDFPLSPPASAVPAIVQAMLAIRHFRDEDSFAARLQIECQLHVILGHLLECAVPRPSAQAPEPELRCQPAAHFLSANFTAPFEAAHLAQLCHLSLPSFFRRFPLEYGCTAQQFQLRRRMHLAQRLLLSTDLKIAAIAIQCGWNDPFHFSRIFRRFLGCSPAEYRGNYR